MIPEFGGPREQIPWFKRRWVIVSGVFVAFMALSGIGAVEYSHEPNFCLSCHIMQPYYDNWQTSSHKGVNCVDCHYEPGFRNKIKGKFQALTQLVTYLNGTYGTNPSAQIQDASCLQSGCHETRLLEGPIEFKQGIKFDHAAHINQPVRGIGLKCTSCHSQIVQGDHMSVTESVCFTCHFKGQVSPAQLREQSFCTFCHEPPEKPIMIDGQPYLHSYYVSIGVDCQRCHQDVIKGEGGVSLMRCKQCHPEQERTQHLTDFQFMHDKHVTDVKIECFECHDEIRHHLPQKEAPPMTNCNFCHVATHDAPVQLYMGVGGKGIDTPMPARMFQAQVDCIGCHSEAHGFGPDSAGHIIKSEATVDTCVLCHQEGGREMYNDWKVRVPGLLAPVKEKLPRAEAKVKALPAGSPDKERFENLVFEARYNLELVEKGNAMHNIQYAGALLQKSEEWLDEVLK